MYSPAHKHLGGRQEEGEFESSQDFRESPCEGKEEAVPLRSECICPTHLLTAVPGVVQWVSWVCRQLVKVDFGCADVLLSRENFVVE